MSNDIMPCGCAGHADNSHLCRYPALEEENEKLRAEVTRLKDEVGVYEEQLAAAEVEVAELQEKIREGGDQA